MNPEERERRAEAWLDEAIASLRDTGPREELEKRVVAGVRAYADSQRRRWTYLVAASAAAVLITAIALTWPRSKSAPTPEVVQKKPAVETNVSSSSRTPSQDHQPKANHPGAPRQMEVQSAGVTRSPMLKPSFEKREATFPSPASPNDQGKLLQAFLRKTPPQDVALIATRQPSLSSLESKDLEIAPLQIADLNPKVEEPKDQDRK